MTKMEGTQAMFSRWIFGWKNKDRSIAKQNLSSIIAHLPQSYRAALNRFCVRFKWHSRMKVSGVSDYDNKTIELNILEFCRFKYDPDKPSHNQRWCVATLKEEIVHFVATHDGFDTSAEWKLAVKSDMKTKSKLRQKLFQKQREYDSADDEIKCSVDEYKKRERAEEWLVDVLLVREYLQARGEPEERIEQKMIKAFPESYPLALAFRETSLSCYSGPKITK